MMSHKLPIGEPGLSLSGKSWRWRGGNMDMAGDTLNITRGNGAGCGPHQQLGDDLVSQLLLARGVPRDDLDRHRTPTLRAFLPDPSVLRDMDKAAERLADAVIARENIAVYGDYDVDGATSAALMIRLLQMLGHSARPYIPDRLLEGYGPSGEALVRLANEGARLIVTVDCGAMAHEALAMASDHGVDVIVVDHHKCSVELPRAMALVNPNRLDESDEGAAFGHLAAVGVAFLLAIATTRALRQRGWFNATRAEPDLLTLLDLVALGTVADVAQIRGLNRALVSQGLKVMAKRQNIGMAALIDVSRLTRPPTCSDLGFALGPRINAGGRVGASDLGVRLLTTHDGEEAQALAAELSRLNEERRAIEAEVQTAAEAEAERQHHCAVLVIAGIGWHPGVIGIVAGRIKEKWGKPCFVIALDSQTESGESHTKSNAIGEDSGSNAIGKGSGRSLVGVDIGAAVIAAREAGLLIAGGGHAMAAGMTIAAKHVDDFAQWINERLADDVASSRGGESFALDLAVAPRGLNPELIKRLESAGPFGMGWPAPRLAVGPVRVIKADVVGADHVRLIVQGSDGARFKAMAFRAAQSDLGQSLLFGSRERSLWLAGRARLDDWGQRLSAELHLEDAAWAGV